MDASFDMLTFKISDDLTTLGKDIKKTLIAHSENKTLREYPSVYMIIPKAKLKGVFNLLTNLTKDMYDIHCFCEFQFAFGDSKECTALWHPVETEAGQFFSKTVKEPNDVVKKLGPYLKVACIALKVGHCVAKLAGIPLPDVSQLIPNDLMQFKDSLVSAITDSAKGAFADDDLAVIAAVRNGEIGTGRLLPDTLTGDRLVLAKSLFNPAQVP